MPEPGLPVSLHRAHRPVLESCGGCCPVAPGGRYLSLNGTHIDHESALERGLISLGFPSGVSGKSSSLLVGRTAEAMPVEESQKAMVWGPWRFREQHVGTVAGYRSSEGVERVVLSLQTFMGGRERTELPTDWQTEQNILMGKLRCWSSEPAGGLPVLVQCAVYPCAEGVLGGGSAAQASCFPNTGMALILAMQSVRLQQMAWNKGILRSAGLRQPPSE